MTLHIHHLRGCAPAPLALYLKTIGILRLVAEQADPEVCGWWKDEHFCLMTKLNRIELEKFFLEDYSPTAVFNPWGARSGFYDGGNEKTARLGIREIENSSLPRLKRFRECIAAVRAVVQRNGGAKPKSKADEAWLSMVKELRKNIRGQGEAWLSTVLVDLGSEFYGPPIFGTGGNEGSGGYTAAFFAALGQCLIQRSWDDSLSASIFRGSESAQHSWDGTFLVSNPKNTTKLKRENVNSPFRQFLPEGDLPPWDLILMFEGACAFRSGVTNRSSSPSNDRFVSSPFYFAPHGVGAMTSCDSDEFVINKGRRQPGRGEQWFPLWKSPTSYREFQALLLEGKCSIRRKRARKPIDGARAIGRLGVNRGITEFVRYGYLQRNNLATHFAVPLGRVRVQQNPRSDLIENIARWVDQLQREARKKNAPARLVHAERRLADAVFAVLTHDNTSPRWQAVLEAAVEIESLQAGGTALKAEPIPQLHPGWIEAIHDNSPELRLALSLGSAAANFAKDGQPIDRIRHHWLPLQRGAWRFQISDGRLVKDSRVVIQGRDPVVDLAAVVSRRLLEAEAGSRRVLPLRSARGCAARLSDLAALIDGHVDLARVLTLSRALMAIDWKKWNPEMLPRVQPSKEHPDEAWLALRLACLPFPIDKELSIPAESSLVSRLLAGDGSGAARVAAQRLGASGIRIPFRSALTDVETARLWAAALAFPISQHSARRAVEVLVPDFFGDSHG